MSPDRLISPEINKFAIEKIMIAGNRGPCGGVNMALEAAEQVLDIVDGREKVYSVWDIVHNKPVIEELRSKGLTSVSYDVSLIPDHAIAMKPAHGGPPWLDEYAKEHGWEWIDVTCQLVDNVKNRSKRNEADGFHIVYIGKQGHPETIAVVGNLQDNNASLVEGLADVINLDLPATKRKIVYSQTTLSPRHVEKVENALRNKFRGSIVTENGEQVPELEIPNRLGICYATYNRQAAVEELAEKVNLLLVVGSGHSHNSSELRMTALDKGTRSEQIDFPHELESDWFTPSTIRVGITSGASVLDRFMDPIVNWILERSPRAQIEYLPQVKEERQMTFKLPQASIDRLRARYAA